MAFLLRSKAYLQKKLQCKLAGCTCVAFCSFQHFLIPLLLTSQQNLEISLMPRNLSWKQLYRTWMFSRAQPLELAVKVKQTSEIEIRKQSDRWLWFQDIKNHHNTQKLKREHWAFFLKLVKMFQNKIVLYRIAT